MKISAVTIFLIILCLVSAFPVSATAVITDDLSDRLFSDMDEQISDALDDFGITTIDSESIFNISVENIFLYFKENFSVYFSSSLKLFTKVLGVIIIAGVFAFIIDEKKYKDAINILLVPIVTVIIVEELNLCISSAMALIRLNGNFILAFVPVYAIAVAVSGNPATAITYNTMVLGFSEIISAVLNYVFSDIIGCYFCLCIGFSVNKSINFPRFISAVNRFVSFVLGLISSVFASVLTVKGIFSAATDSVSAKGIRFAIGSLIPVIGSSISEAYSTLIGSIGILKNSVALIGIIAVMLISTPVIIEIALFNISLNMLSFISEFFECNELSDSLRAFASGVKIIGLVAVFEAFILIISTAVVMSIKGG